MHQIKESIKFLRDIFTSIYTIVLIVKFYFKKEKNACILVTNGMGYGGAPLVLMEAAKIYRKNGYRVIIYTEFYGDLVKVCRDQGIEVWIAPRGWKFISKAMLHCSFKFAFINTIVMYEWVYLFEKHDIPTVWWLHESETYIDPISSKLPEKVSPNTIILAVSERTIKALQKNNLKYNPELLYYGLEDLVNYQNDNIKKAKNIFTFLVMGAICYRKNQLFAIQAYKLLPKAIKENIKLVFVGAPLDKNDTYYLNFIHELKNYPEIQYIPQIERKDISSLYESISSLICCSIDDPMPVVVSECLMFSKTVIVSSGAGQYYMIKDGYNGYSYPKDSVNALCAKMILAYDRKNDEQITVHAREVYNNNFSKKVFEDRLMLLTNNLLNL